MVCSKCNLPCTAMYGGLCEVCQADGRDPIMWLIETVEAQRAEKAKNKMLRWVPSGSHFIKLDRAGNLARGTGNDDIAIGLVLSGDDVHLGYRIERWRDGGMTALAPVTGKATYIELPVIIREQIKKIWHLVDQDLFECATCGTPLGDDAVAGRHFAGAYCAECWEKYKKSNSQRYGCGHRAYECHC